jgi:hypothetical protein
MRREFKAGIKPQRRDVRREMNCSTISALFAVQKARIAQFEQDFLSCCLLRAHRVSAVQGALAFWLRLRYSKPLRFLGYSSKRLCAPAHHDPSKPISQCKRVEVEEQPQLPPPQPKLAEQPGFMDGLNLSQGTRTHHDSSADQQFNFVQLGQFGALIAERQGAFALECHAPQVQFMTQARLVCRGQQARPQFAVNLNRTGDDLASQRFSFSISTVRRGIEGRHRVRIPRSDSGRAMRPHAAFPFFLQTKHQPLYAFLQDGHVEVEQQRQLPAPQFEVGERLRSVHWEDSFDRFYLDHHSVGDKHIEPKAALKLHAFVNHRHWLLHPRRKASQSKLVRECPFVSCFGFPGSKFTMHLDGGADDFMGKLVRSHRRRVIVTKRGVNSTEVGDNGMAFSCATETAETRRAQRRNGAEPLRSSQCKRPESRNSSKIFSPAVFSALIASLRFKGRSHFGCGSLLQASAVFLRPPFASCSRIVPLGVYRITNRPNASNSNQQYALEQVVTVAPRDRTNVKVVYE